MAKTLKIVRREYIEIVRKKGFIIGLFVMPIFIVGVTLLPALLTGVKVEKQKRLAIVDLAGDIHDPFSARLDTKLKDGRPEYVIQRREVGADLEELKGRLSKEIQRGKLDAYLLIPTDIYDRGHVEYYGKKVSDFVELRRLRDTLTRIVVERRLTDEGLDPREIRRWTRRVQLESRTIHLGNQIPVDEQLTPRANVNGHRFLLVP